MTPLEYLRRYHRLAVVLDDWFGTIVPLAKYVSGTGTPAWDARGPLLAGVAHELNQASGSHFTAWNLPRSFIIDGSQITLMGILRVFMGKASPDEIADAMGLLLSRCKLLAEGAGAAATAALVTGKIVVRETDHVVALLSGGNVDLARLTELLTQSES